MLAILGSGLQSTPDEIPVKTDPHELIMIIKRFILKMYFCQ